MAKLFYFNAHHQDAYTSPRSLRENLLFRFWECFWLFFISWLPKKASAWYLFWLRIFGTKVTGRPFVDPTCRIYAPWLLTLEDRACLAPRSEVYNVGPVHIGAHATVAQYAYLCNGTHDLSRASTPLMGGDLRIGPYVFIGAKAIILPGLTLGEGSVVGAGSVLTKDTEAYAIYAGNPARYRKPRPFTHE